MTTLDNVDEFPRKSMKKMTAELETCSNEKKRIKWHLQHAGSNPSSIASQTAEQNGQIATHVQRCEAGCLHRENIQRLQHFLQLWTLNYSMTHWTIHDTNAV